MDTPPSLDCTPNIAALHPFHDNEENIATDSFQQTGLAESIPPNLSVGKNLWLCRFSRSEMLNLASSEKS